jgi:hypothetical protein
MTSRNNPSHNKLTKADRIKDRQQLLGALDAQQAREKVDAILVNTASSVYASLVAKAWDGDETLIPDEVFRKLAFIAKSSIPFFGQVFGMLNPPPDIRDVRAVEAPKPNEVIELPVENSVDPESSTISSTMTSGSSVIVLESHAAEESK